MISIVYEQKAIEVLARQEYEYLCAPNNALCQGICRYMHILEPMSDNIQYPSGPALGISEIFLDMFNCIYLFLNLLLH